MSYLHSTPPGSSQSEHARELDAARPKDAHESRPLRVMPVVTTGPISMTENINNHLTDIIADVNKVRKACNDDERPPEIDEDAIITRLSNISNALDDLYNEVRGI